MQSSSRRPSVILLGSLLLVTLFSTWAKDKDPKTYPEQGTVVSERTQEQPVTTPVYTDPYGKTQGGFSSIRRLPVYRIEADTKFYELEGKRRGEPLALGSTIGFRIDKKWAFVQQGDKEQKFRIVGIELKQNK